MVLGDTCKKGRTRSSKFLMTTGHVSADFRQGTPSIRNGVRLDKFGIDPMAVDGKR